MDKVDKSQMPPDTGGAHAIAAQAAKSWDEIFALLDEAEIPDDFLADQAQEFRQQRKYS